MEADGAPFTPLPLSVLRFTGIQSYGHTDQRKVETGKRMAASFGYFMVATCSVHLKQNFGRKGKY